MGRPQSGEEVTSGGQRRHYTVTSHSKMTSRDRKMTSHRERLVTSMLCLLVAAVLSRLPGTSAQSGQELFRCNFDNNQLCGMEQSRSDNFDWSLGFGRTPTGQIHVNDSQQTGPAGGQGNSRHYIFIETSAPRRPGESARLLTPVLDGRRYPNICVDFYFHTLGAAIGTLGVYIVTPGSPDYTLWTNSENNIGSRDQWIRVTRQATIQSGSRVEFRGSVGGFRTPDVIWSGDLAFDSIRITAGSCIGGPPVPTPPPPTTTEGPPDPTPSTPIPTDGDDVVLPFVCDFEQTTLCGMTGISAPGVYPWQRQRDSTPTIGTGPNRAFSGSYYIYVESSEPRVANDRFIIQTLPIRIPVRNQDPDPSREDVCVSFAFHMNGPDIQRFLVYSSRTSQIIFDAVGSQGPDWRQTTQTVTLTDAERIIFEVTRGADIRGDVALDNLRIDPVPCSSSTPSPTRPPTPTNQPTRPPGPVRRLPWTCGFERDFCGMQQSTTDRFDFTRIVLTTPTVGTGPQSARGGTYYIFIEGSDPRIPNDIALIATPMFDTSGAVCVEFFYHMYGSGMGTLRVFVNRFGPSFPAFERRGNQGNQWRFERVTLTNFNYGDQVAFEATRGQSYTSDIALDDISVYQGSCDGSVPTPAPTPGPPTAGPPSTGERFSCNAEDAQGNAVNCRLRQDTREDQLDWIRVSGKTPSGALYSRRTPNGLYPVTGPDGARQGRYYLYIEASGRPRDLMARMFIEGSDVTRGGEACLRFYYSMNGFHMGDLRIYTRAGGAARLTKWSLTGDQGRGWQSAAVDINMNGISELGVEATTRGEFSGDISIDDIRLQAGRCEATPSQYVFLCNFETGSGSATLCGMEQDRGDRFDWTLGKGPTPSQVTGPDRAFSGEYYMFIEASRPRVRGDFAVLLTPPISRNGDLCTEVMYNMFGYHIGSLEVFTRDGFSADSTVWSESGEKGNQWRQARVTFTNFRSGTRIGFRAIRGTEYSGDIAIDSIMIRPNRC